MTRKKVHVRKDDLVQVITGKDAGKQGKILNVDPRKGRVVVEGVNIVKRHMRPTQANPQGGIMEIEAPVDSSNVMLVCQKCDVPVRIKKKFLADGKKVRVCNRCGEEFDK
ncbi:MAG TPA: 50S ribosomal protein L24 [Clostridia bacterium]|jgi:large subunit ribosomal protein L24|nr:50S ribosomal protein L24 [Clostridia bacterium]